MMTSKKVAQENYTKTAKEKKVIAQQTRQQMTNLVSLKRKRKRNIKNIKKVFAVMLVKKINQGKRRSVANWNHSHCG